MREDSMVETKINRVVSSAEWVGTIFIFLLAGHKVYFIALYRVNKFIF